jgi:hypothetical protein
VLSSRPARVPADAVFIVSAFPSLTLSIQFLKLLLLSIKSYFYSQLIEKKTPNPSSFIMSYYGGPPQNQQGGYYDQQGQNHYPQGHSPQPQQGYYPPEVRISIGLIPRYNTQLSPLIVSTTTIHN